MSMSVSGICDCLQPDGSAWRAEPTTAERTLVGLAVPDCGIALVNGALPSSFDPQHTPGSWWMEAIFKVGGWVCGWVLTG